MRSTGKGGSQTVLTEAQAEACSYQDLEVARCQQAMSLELRAAVLLSQSLRRQGKRGATCKL
jgi:hypothetical protein